MEDSNGLVLLVRLKDAGLTQRSVHVVPLPLPSASQVYGYVTALCGVTLDMARCETVPDATGMPCTACLLVTPLPQDQP